MTTELTPPTYRRLGSSGLHVSAIALGTMQFGWTAGEETSFAIMDEFAGWGGTLIDTADSYSAWADGNAGGVSEEIIGRWLKARGNRDDLVIATKVRSPGGPRFSQGRKTRHQREGLSRRWILRACEDSLRRLGIEHIDLYQAHSFDPYTPIEETLSAFTDLVRRGLVRYIGCSNFSAWQLTQALWVSDKRGYAPFVSVQPRYSLLERAIERELLPACRAFGIGIVPYSPLAGGLLTGKYRGGARPEGARGTEQAASGFFERQLAGKDERMIDRLAEWAEARGHQLGELAVAWLLGHPEVSTVIAGVTTPEQVDENARAAGWTLTPEEVEEVGRLVE
jgi:aryl-alcohol dehydrogenase-like predicted oxidoreductase